MISWHLGPIVGHLVEYGPATGLSPVLAQTFIYLFFWPHLGVVAGEHLERYGRDELPNKVQPLLLVVDLLHVDVVRGDTLVAARDTPVLKDHTDRPRAIPWAMSKHSTW